MYGDKIRRLRKERKDTLRSLADKLEYHHTTLGKVENGKVEATIKLLEKIAKVYDVPMSYFLDEEIPPELKEIGVEWVSFAKEMKDKALTPDEIRAAVELIEKFRK